MWGDVAVNRIEWHKNLRLFYPHKPVENCPMSYIRLFIDSQISINPRSFIHYLI